MMFVFPLHILILWSGLLSVFAAAFPIASGLRTVLSDGVPEITLTAPVPGQVLDEETIVVAWTASDPDGDDLFFRVDYSNDGGVIWRTVAQDIVGNSTEIARTKITASNQARFRVWATDGVNQTVDEIDGDVMVTDWPPTVEITMPAARSLFLIGETITFIGTAHDIDAGPIGGFALAWHSDIDGFLGRGNRMTHSSLSPGDHVISLRTPDGQGGHVEDNILIHIIHADLRIFFPRLAR